MISKIKYILGFIFDRRIPLFKKYNFFLLFIERFFSKNTKLFSKPYLYIVEATTACNLRCKKCIHGEEGGINIGKLSYENFEKIFNKIKKYALTIGFVNWGEAFLNEDIFKMVKLCVQGNIKVDFSTNLNFRDQRLLERIVESGIEQLTISIDGITRSTYSLYRNGGNFELVLGNIRHMQDYKKKINTKFPRIYWQFLVHKHNEAEMEQAKVLAKELGVTLFFNKFRPTMHREVFMSDREKYDDLNDWFPLKSDISYKQVLSEAKSRRCFNPWIMCVINFDGGVYPCCSLIGEQYYFGNLLNNGFKEIWNNDKFISARSIILSKDVPAGKDVLVCAVCKKNNFTLY